MKSCGATPLLSARAGPIVTINPTTRSQSARVIIGYLYDRGREHTRSIRARHFDLHHRPRRSGIQTRGGLSLCNAAIATQSTALRVKGMGISEVQTAPHRPWQNPCAE